jgi:hypothetical protein
VEFGSVNITPGGPILPTLHLWTWHAPEGVASVTSTILPFWAESPPGAIPRLADGLGVNGSNEILVNSDFDLTGFGNVTIPNGTIVQGMLVFTYVDGTTQMFDAQFNDLGDTAGVPDATSTAGMLILSTGALCGVARRARHL